MYGPDPAGHEFNSMTITYGPKHALPKGEAMGQPSASVPTTDR